MLPFSSVSMGTRSVLHEVPKVRKGGEECGVGGRERCKKDHRPVIIFSLLVEVMILGWELGPGVRKSRHQLETVHTREYLQKTVLLWAQSILQGHGRHERLNLSLPLPASWRQYENKG